MDNKEIKLKQLRFRSAYRGFNEMDRIMERFAAEHLDQLDDALLAEYEQLLNLPDLDVFGWLVGQEEPPATAPLNIIAFIRKMIAG